VGKFPQDSAKLLTKEVIDSEKIYLTTEIPLTAEQVLTLRKEYQKMEEVAAHQSGKEEMFRYVFWYFKENYPNVNVEYRVYDDRVEVIKVAKGLAAEGFNLTNELVVCPLPEIPQISSTSNSSQSSQQPSESSEPKKHDEPVPPAQPAPPTNVFEFFDRWRCYLC
jgi:hypothetical protein